MSLPVRTIARKVRTPAPAPGFAGPGHTAVEVLTSRALADSDPFVLLMDDRVDFPPGRQLGGAHPHAGLETVTLVLEGAIEDRDEGVLSAGDAAWMTAGRGIIHNEHVQGMGYVRILQLWVALPSAEREAEPRLQLLPAHSVPVRREPGVEARLYSGHTGGESSPTQNHVPVTLVDFILEPGARVEQELPLSYNGFLYVVDGSLQAVADSAGDSPARNSAVPTLEKGEVGWLDRPTGTGGSQLVLRAGPSGARCVLYAGEPQREPQVQYGPFVAGSMVDIQALYQRYNKGGFKRLSSLTAQVFAG